MKFAIIQPQYKMEFDQVDVCFEKLMELLEHCDSSMDVIVLPEYSDVPSNIRNKAEYDAYVEKNHDRLIEKVSETAVRCGAVIFVNSAYKTEKGYRNTTFAIGKNGKILGKYFKAHPAPSEVRGADRGGIALDVGYSYEYSEPCVMEIEGVKYGFLTCYDFYFYENFPNLARKNIDVIIGCSLQRTDTHSALEIINRFLCYNTNAYLVRSSVSLGADSKVCGSSMIVAPNGDMLVNMKNEVGIATYEIDPKTKYYKPAGFGGLPKAHYEYIEEGRRPWNYREGGASCVPSDSIMPYPRICAHRGFSDIVPENSMAAFGAAVAMDTDEIEFDIWPTADGELVTCHDDTLDRVSTGHGVIHTMTYDEITKADFGVKFSDKLKGMTVIKFEDILRKFARRVIMNVHIKPISYTEPYPVDIMKKIVALVRKYDCNEHCYFMLEPDIHIKQFREYAPDIPVCVGQLESRRYEIVDRAIALGAEKVQFFKPDFSKEMVDKAHAHGIICNVFWSDDEKEARELLEMGMDTILSNNFFRIKQVVDEFRKK